MLGLGKSAASSPTTDQPGHEEAPAVFESYLCTEPAGDIEILTHNGPDEYTARQRTLQRAADYWLERGRGRALQLIRYEQAKLHMQNEQWGQAMRILVPLWQDVSWRRAGWWGLLKAFDLTLRQCASQVEDVRVEAAVDWELTHRGQ